MRLSNFSANYVLAPDMDVELHSGNSAIMQDTLYEKLVEVFGEPLYALIGGVRFEFQPDRAVPDETAAIPNRTGRDSDLYETVLLEKPTGRTVVA